jgi:hypothetical protein
MIVAFFDARIERIAIHMRDRQIKQFAMGGHTRAATRGAACSIVKGVQTGAAKGWHTDQYARLYI